LRLIKIISFFLILVNICYSQNDTSIVNDSLYVEDSLDIKVSPRDSLLEAVHKRDSVYMLISENPGYIDSLNFTVSDIIITGNEITKPEVITREMHLKLGKKFTIEKYEHDLMKIYNTGLFMKVDIIPIPVTNKDLVLNVDVHEKWYILPLPDGGIDEGDWKKIWVGLNLKWENFRGRNETAALYFRLFYNPSVRVSYSVPWIGEKLHLYSSISAGYSRTRNQSLTAIGKTQNSTIGYNEDNYDNYRFNTLWTIGKYITDGISVFTDAGFDYLKVSKYETDRTVSPTGRDKYIILGAGIKYDSRDNFEYATKGYYIRSSFTRYGYLDKTIDFGRFNFESQSFIPFHFSKNYYITFASRVYTSQAIGAVIPLYHHEFLGYGDKYIRGWKGHAFEGDDLLTVYNEIRIPILKPRFIKADELPLLKDLPIIQKLDLKHGIYFSFLYDIGAVWYKGDNLKHVHFRSGAGIGLNIILPFGYVLRADWAFRITKPVVGEIGLSLNAKF
jgi:outer membrane protein assembly factor BamA